MSLRQIDAAIVRFLQRWSVPLLRISLGIVFIWCGALTVFAMTPVTDLVAATVYWVDPDWFVPALGVVEMIVGIGLIVRRALRIVLILFVAQMAGTFMVLIVVPEVAFEGGNVIESTVEGEFVIKNLVLLTAGLVVGSTVGSAEETTQAGVGDLERRPLRH